MLGINFGNGTVTTYGYFPYSKRLQSIATKQSSAATNFQSLSYTFNAVADLLSYLESLQ